MDDARGWTDNELLSLERAIERNYMQARREMHEKQKSWLKEFAEERETREKALDGTEEAMKAHKAWLSEQATRSRWFADMVAGLSESAHMANVKAAELVNDSIPHVFAENANMAAFAIDGKLGIDAGFSLVNEDAVRKLVIAEQFDGQLVKEVVSHEPYIAPGYTQSLRKREIDYPKDMRWNRQKFTAAIIQGILQGESIPNIVKRTDGIFGQNRNAAVRAARTATTNAENAGRMATFERALRLGIDMEIEWLATPDSRTRDSHRHIDGERVMVGERFSNGLRWPGDILGRPEECWNCRCRANGRVVGFDGKRGDWADDRGGRWARLPKGMTYDDWKAGKGA